MLFYNNGDKSRKPKNSNDKFKTLQDENEKKLTQFVEFFEYACYKLSWILNSPKRQRLDSNNHTHGGVVNLLNRLKLPKSIWEKWILEPEHGFMHGFCTLYFAYHLHPNKQALWDDLAWYERKVDRHKPRFTKADNLIVSCLIHDVMRLVYSENHDIKLMELSPLLLPEVYTHSNPEKDSLLVLSDRIELMRYQDYKIWVDESKLTKQIELYGGFDLINHFFKHIRPVLENMFVNRYDIWFSHALEIQDFPIWKAMDNGKPDANNFGVPYYPKFHWVPLDPGFTAYMKPEYKKYFSVHSGRLPFINCLSHTHRYYGVQGIISLNTIKKYGCEISCAPPSTAGRDHVFIVENNKLPTKEWSFLYDNKNDTHETVKPTYVKESHLDQIEESDLTTMKASLFNDIYRVSELFVTNLLCLSCIN